MVTLRGGSGGVDSRDVSSHDVSVPCVNLSTETGESFKCNSFTAKRS